MKNKFAFTLAEVLITLVIIGVVAALTIPTAINRMQREELRSQFKKAVSVASQVIQKMKIDYGDVVFDSPNDSAQVIRDRFMSYFSVICKSNCIDASRYKNFANLDDYAISVYISNLGFITQDGSSYGFRKGSSGNMYITIDINGPDKKPNRWGYDTFTFYIPFDSQILKPCEAGVPISDMCCNNSKNSHNGAGCAVKAIFDPNYFKNLP